VIPATRQRRSDPARRSIAFVAAQCAVLRCDNHPVHRFHAPGAMPPSVALRDGEAAHLTRVLRLGPGAEIVVFDGEGREWLGRVASVGRTEAVVDLGRPLVPAAEPPVHVTLAVGLLKRDEMDHVVRDATMLGVVRIAPFTSARVVVPGRSRQDEAIERWTRVAIASAKQCARAVVPRIAPVMPLAPLMTDPDHDLRIVCVEPSAAAGDQVQDLPRPVRALVCIGPEGGWTDQELAAARAAGAHLVSLGPRRLRADTAPAVALAALWTVWGWD
jgi:16S rRNA (uracil1498-N3)-methyltransferase